MQLWLIALFILLMTLLDVYGYDNNEEYKEYTILFECSIDGERKQIGAYELDYDHYYDLTTDKEVIVTDFKTLTDVKCEYIK